MRTVTRLLLMLMACGLLVPPRWCCASRMARASCCDVQFGRQSAGTLFRAGPSTPRSALIAGGCCAKRLPGHGEERLAESPDMFGAVSRSGRELPPPVLPGGCCDERVRGIKAWAGSDFSVKPASSYLVSRCVAASAEGAAASIELFPIGAIPPPDLQATLCCWRK